MKIAAIGLPRLTEPEITANVVDQVSAQYGLESITDDDILGAQYMRPQTYWIVYCINLTVKGRVLSLGTLEVENIQYPLCDFL